ncbi:MAG: AFG3-like protein 1 isoform X2 [Hyperionvirus sp.]|uniref:AFG3-like protein 1 isoform X2 n=1 Tax=Hyperionvirus sp. TaxID=2487770 RepID=A0A3G5ABY7_9VIRU|nr:MAG: AFG3-like protein 1 isoform X2 [Hyperionvirus sp.]
MSGRDRLKNIVFVVIVVYYFFEFFGYGRVTIPISVAEQLMREKAGAIREIYIDEGTNHAHLMLNWGSGNTVYVTKFSNHENFKNVLKDLTGEFYGGIIIRYKAGASVTDLVYNIFFGWMGVELVFSLLKIVMPSGFKGGDGDRGSSDGSDDSDGILGISLGGPKISGFYSVVKNSKVKFGDVIGLGNVKEDLAEFVRFMRYEKMFKNNGCELPRGLLFVGPPGVGKTHVAKAFASEAGGMFISTTGSSFNEIYMGIGSKRVRELFKFARANRPCVVFIDEIDAIGSRSSGYDRGELNRTINALLAELDGMNDTTGVMVIGATNLPQMLDPALTRSGRFDKKIVFDPPNFDERVLLFKLYLDKVKQDQSFVGGKEGNVKFLAQRTARLTGADIKNVCNQAILNHMKGYVEKVRAEGKYLENGGADGGCTLKDLTDAIDDIGIGMVKRERAMSEKEKIQVAYHEVGHTLVSCLIKCAGGVPLKVSIIPRGGALGFTQPEDTDNKLMFKKELLGNICVTLGGRCAEAIKFDDITSGASDDLKKVSEMAHSYFSEYCFGDSLCVTVTKLQSNIYKSHVNELVSHLINACYEFTLATLRKEVDLLEIISVKLLEKETLSRSDLLELIPAEKLASVEVKIS